jgi:uncharacterized protein
MSTIYEFSVPVFVKALSGLKTVLVKAKDHGINDEELLSDALAPDMFPFVRQVQIACDNAKGAVSRLAGVEIPSFPDTETTIAELVTRIDTTIAYVESITAEQFVGAEERSITLPYFPGVYMTGYDYLREYAIPNFFFHTTAAYAIVRKNGVSIGKSDYLHSLPLKPLAS